MKLANFIFFFVITFFIICAKQISAGTHNVSASIEISDVAINRYLNTQYNATGFPKSVPVTIGGTNYTMSLALPEIIITSGSAKIRLVFDVNSGATNVYHFEVQPSVNIPTNQITASQIYAYFTDLVTVVNLLNIPSEVKNAVINTYNSIGFNMYPSKLIDQLSTPWMRERALTLDVNNLALAWAVIDGAIKFTVSLPVSSSLPTFTVLLYQNAIAINSKIDITVDNLVLYNGAGEIITEWTTDRFIQREVTNSWGLSSTISQLGAYTIWVLFRIGDTTFYVREYRCTANGVGSELTHSIN